MPKHHFVDSDNFRRMSLRLFSGLLFSSVIGLTAYRRKSLDKSGVLGSIVSGTSIVGMGGWSWGLSLSLFFCLVKPAFFLSRIREGHCCF